MDAENASRVGPPSAQGWEIFAHWHSLIDRRDPRFALLTTVDEVGSALDRFERHTARSLWNMQRHWTVNEIRDADGLNARAVSRHVELRLILPRRVAEARCPLVSSAPHGENLRLAPVAYPLMISDGRRLLLGDSTGETVWTSSDPGIVSGAVAFYERVWGGAPPAVPDGEDPPFTPRMVEIGVRLVDGATDREIARALGVSERTVSADVREMSRRLGARSRAHTIALISGVEG